MQHQRTTGLTPQQFTTLLTVLTHQITWGRPGGRPRPPVLTLHQALKVTLLYHWHNLTEELLAELFGTSQPTISRTLNTVEKALVKLFSSLIPSWEQLTKPQDHWSLMKL